MPTRERHEMARKRYVGRGKNSGWDIILLNTYYSISPTFMFCIKLVVL